MVLSKTKKTFVHVVVACVSCSIKKVHFCLLNFDTIENVDNLSHSDFEGNVLHNDILFNLLISGAVIALYSPTNPRELFFLCKLIGICHADSDKTDYYNHFVPKGTKFIKCYTI